VVVVVRRRESVVAMRVVFMLKVFLFSLDWCC
jgi:hypothetical protein